MKSKPLHFSMGLMLSAALSSSVTAVEFPADVHGYVSQGYLISTENNYIEDSRQGTFDFREYGINASVKPFDRLTFGGQIAGREYGSVGNDAIYVDWLAADYSIWDALGIRAGRMKVPYGLYGETRDIDSLRTEALLPQGVYSEFIREYYNSMDGVAGYGHVPCGPVGGLSYQLQYGERNMDAENGDLRRFMASDGFFPGSFDQEGHVVAALIWDTPIDNLRLKATGSDGAYEMDGTFSKNEDLHNYAPLIFPPGTRYHFTGTLHAETKTDFSGVLSAEYSPGDFVFSAEYMRGKAEYFFTLDTDPNLYGISLPDFPVDQDYSGYYLRGEYRINDRFSTAAGYSLMKHRQVAIFGPMTLIKDVEQQDVSVSLRVDLTDNLILKLEEHLLQNDGGSLFPMENPQGIKEYSTLTVVKLSFIF
ncbi:MAG: OprO/OprP family phosphate-selective porin [Pontiellaceae bacterium]|jgi:hypothetical protein|nr:OprO/OprP family phosphate-selective porin [Pontiellaceae bacterium]